MFELLLQADKSLAAGALDQAERTYWQLVELDSSNAIALAGLARVALVRGDRRMARKYADQALTVDPDSHAAKRVMAALESDAAAEAETAPTHELIAAQNLEALSRRHMADRRTPVFEQSADELDETAEHAPDGEPAPETPVAALSPEEAAAEAEAQAAEAEAIAAETAALAEATVIDKLSRPARHAAGSAPAKPTRGKTRPDQILPMPAEPLKERRQAGRLAAAAAAAAAQAAAAAAPVHARHEPHHAMPMGRRYFEADDLRVPLVADPFSKAEMAAAVEAVDDLPETAEAGAAAGARDDTFNELVNAIDATEADESVAMRIALMAGTTDAEAAPGEASPWPGEDEAAEAEAVARRLALIENEAGLDAAEREAAQAGDATAAADGASFEAAEAGAMADVLEAEPAGGAVEAAAETQARTQPAVLTDEDEQSEEEAEAQALREAMAIVLGGETDAGSTMAAAATAAPAGAGEPQTEEPEPEAPPTTPEDTDIDAGDGRKKGLFSRFRGN
jgi:hypothetical protein